MSPCRSMRSRFACGFGTRDGRQQRPGIGMARRGEQRVGRRGLDDAAEIHHGDAVGDVLHHREIVGDEDVGEAEPLLQVAQQVEDLRADRDVERRHRLVADDQLRLDRERAGDRDALALAAGEFVRIAAARNAARRPTSRSSSSTRARRAAGGTRSCSASGSPRICADRHARIERGVGVLEDDLRLRGGTRAARLSSSASRSRPSKRTLPASGSIRRSTSRPTVDLPQPDSPTSASVSPASSMKVDAIDRAHDGRSAGRTQSRAAGKCLTRPCDFEQRASCHQPSPAARGGSASAVAGRRARRSGGGAVGAGVASTNGQRAAKRQPAGGCAMFGHHALDRGEALRAAVEPRDRAEQADRVGMLRRGEQLVDRRRARRSRRHTSRRPRRRPRRPRRDRA